MLSTFGPPVRTVFRSRWRALWWSAGVLLTAYCSIPKQDAGDNAAPQAAASAQPGTDTHVNPWAKTPAK